MLNFYENRAGKNLSQERKRTLEHAKELLHGKVERHQGAKLSKPSSKSRKAA
jgi:hypothetical protein